MTVYGSPGRRRRVPEHRDRHLGESLALTFASVVLPGTGHLAARRTTAGWAMVLSFIALLAAPILMLAVLPYPELVKLAFRPRTLQVLMAGAVAIGAAWILIVLSTYAVTRPRVMSEAQRVAGGIVVALLCVAVGAPFLVGARYAYVQHDLVSHVFGGNQGSGERGDLFAGKERINVLLLGSDAGKGRESARTDTMIVASIHIETGRTVLIGLPRNLMNAPFEPGSTMAERYPYGFDDMLSHVYRYGIEHPEVVSDPEHAGGELLKQTVGTIIGLPIDYFVLANLAGFQQLVNAFGGVTIRVDRRIPIGGVTENGIVIKQPHDYIEPGLQHLNGYKALWYGRSRFGSDDYARMGRQRCLLGAMAKQANPLKVLTRFQQLAGATKDMVLTDVPQSVVPDLVALAAKGRSAKISSLSFVRSSEFTPSDPDFVYIREKVADAIQKSTNPPSPTAPPDEPDRTGGNDGNGGNGTTEGSTGGSNDTGNGTNSGDPSPQKSPGEPVSVDEECQYE